MAQWLSDQASSYAHPSASAQTVPSSIPKTRRASYIAHASITFARERLHIDEFCIMRPAGPHFQSRGSVRGHNVLQGLTTGDNTTINFKNDNKAEAPQLEKEGVRYSSLVLRTVSRS